MIEPKERITLIGAILVFLVGLINIFLTGHRNNTEGVAKYRKEWIAEVRSLTAQVLGGETEGAVYKIEQLLLYLNPSKNHSLDQDLVCLFKLLKNVYITDLSNPQDTTPARIDFKKRSLMLVSEIEEKMRVYLKMEWTRVKYESAIFIGKFQYRTCWKLKYWPWSGFSEKNALTEISRQYGINLDKSEFISINPSCNNSQPSPLPTTADPEPME